MTTLLLALAALAGAAPQGAPPAAPMLFGSPWTILIGEWTGEGQGQPGAGSGTATFALDLERHVLVRRASSDYPAAEGRPAAHHEDLLVIYPDGAGPAARAVYFDNEGHVIEYAAAWSADGRVLTFVSAARPNAPGFRLTYRVLADGRLAVGFEIAPPGSDVFKPYVSGVMRRAGGR
jgi:hypothetical protein